MKILILCTGNSCRSQMAHGFLQSFDNKLQVYSGGTEPAMEINSIAVQIMAESNIDISKHIPTHVDKYMNEEWDYVITVCDDAKEKCPIFNGTVKKKIHIGFDDPSHAIGTDDFIMSEYYRVQDEIRVVFLDFYHSLV